MPELDGRSAIVTGGAQGIGAAIVRRLVAAGARVAVIDRQLEKAQAIAAELAPHAVAIGADLGCQKDCVAAVSAARAALGGVGILVNNAAPGRDRSKVGRIADADWEEHHATVLRAAAWLTEAALPDLSASGHGAIVSVSSALARAIGFEQATAPYHVSKAGLEQFTRWLAVRCGEQGVRVNAVAPGLVDRDGGPRLTDNPVHRRIVELVVPLRRAASGREVADAVLFLSSDAASYISGHVLTVDGGLAAREVFGASLRAFNAARDIGDP
jgi:glucose 1-dehydrogenase